MAAPAQTTTVYIYTANGQTITGPLRVKSILIVPGSTNTSVQFTVGGQKVFDSGTLAANGPSVIYPHTGLRLSQSQDFTAAMSGTGASAYVYIE